MPRLILKLLLTKLLFMGAEKVNPSLFHKIDKGMYESSFDNIHIKRNLSFLKNKDYYINAKVHKITD